ncbi:unnamed protein product [Paramecium octaurelia]|uniref:Transmembrane protein n=1 Tax=Paramecium octaurelia TaxID=43137 RepID=A0A8S1TMH1_PAROT|nr:unnamed protein product [Paramecium octaurelia]
MLLCIFLILSIQAKQIKQPSPRYINETIEPGNYNRQAQEKLSIQYGAYPGVFAVDLHKRVNGQMGSQSFNLDDFEKVEEDIIGEYGCFAIQQNLEISYQLKLWLDKTGVTRDVYFTDLATSESSSRIYVVRNDFKIFSINLDKGYFGISLDSQQQSFASLLKYDPEGDFNHPFLIDDMGENRIYIITSNGGASFNTDTQLALSQFRLETEVKQKDFIFNVHYNVKHKLIYVACGHDGLDVYKISNNQLVFVSTITTIQLGIPQGQVIDVDSNGDDRLYVLDKETGLRFYKIYNLENGQVAHLFTITISKTKSFDHFESTFFIVAKTVNNQDFAVEVFVDFQNADYFFNNYYIDEMTINDVNVFEYYAVLIGDDGHKIVQHSIYSGFLDEKLLSHTSFQDPDLFKLKEYSYEEQNNLNIRLLVGIARYEFKFMTIKMNHPIVECKFEDAEVNQYIVLLNSTNCKGKEETPDVWQQQFTLCNITHSFTFTTTEIPGNYYTYAYYTIAIYVLFVIIVWLIIFMYVCFKKWGHKLSFLAWKKKIVDSTAPYNESFDVKEQEMADQKSRS